MNIDLLQISSKEGQNNKRENIDRLRRCFDYTAAKHAAYRWDFRRIIYLSKNHANNIHAIHVRITKKRRKCFCTSAAKNAACRNSASRFYVTRQFRDSFTRPPEFSRCSATSDDVAVKFSVESAVYTYTAFRHGPRLLSTILGDTCDRGMAVDVTHKEEKPQDMLRIWTHILQPVHNFAANGHMILQRSDASKNEILRIYNLNSIHKLRVKINQI